MYMHVYIIMMARKFKMPLFFNVTDGHALLMHEITICKQRMNI